MELDAVSAATSMTSGWKSAVLYAGSALDLKAALNLLWNSLKWLRSGS